MDKTLLNLVVPGMTCGHCQRAVTEALVALDAQAEVKVDLQTKQVAVNTQASRSEVVAALGDAGYEVS